MSLSWRDEIRVGVCARRLAVARYRRLPRRRLIESAVYPIAAEPAAEVAKLGANARLTLVLSNHLVRYALLPWSRTLGSEAEWREYARHAFSATYGDAAKGWEVHFCATGLRQPRLACAVDAALLSTLRGVKGVSSVQPYLMSAFNACRRRLPREAAWFVLQEEERLTIALLAGSLWRLVRSRKAPGDWRALLPDLLDRERAAAEDVACDRVYLCAESAAPARLGRYAVTDLTLPAGIPPGARAASMALA